MSKRTHSGIAFLAIAAACFMAPASFAQIAFTNSNSLLPTTDVHSGVPMAVGDMNGDKLDDIIRLDDRRDLIINYQVPGGAFTEDATYGQVGQGTKWAIVIGDLDNNGYNDIMTGGSYNEVDILMANGTGTGYTGGIAPSANIFVQGSNFADIDNDGWLDVFACHDHGPSATWRNDGAGGLITETSWFDMTTVPASDMSGNYGTTFTDFDDDGDLDLYISKCRQGVNDPFDGRRINMLFVNDGNNNYTQDLSDAAGLRIDWQSWTADFQDIDNDGDFDVFVTNHDHECQLLENNGDGTFTDITAGSGIEITGLAIQGLFNDFDNDGFLDLIVPGQVQHLFRSNGDKTFTDVTYVLDNNNMESCAIGDLNHDGFLDIYGGYATTFNSPTTIDDVLWLNNGNSNNFLAFDLEGTASNRNAVGAKLKLYGPWGTQVREIRAGESYGISNSFTMHFGLGSETMADSVVISWPAGGTQTITNIDANQFVTVVEGGCVNADANVTPDGPLAFCSGSTNSIVLSAEAGNTYAWSTGETTQDITITTPGTYLVTVTNAAGCSATSQAMSPPTDPDETPIIVVSGDVEFCSSASTELSSNQPTGNTWSNGATTQTITVTATGSYTVTYEGVCTDWTSNTVDLAVYDHPTPPTADDVTIPLPGTATLTATSGTNLYWYDVPTGGAPIGVGATIEPTVTATTTYYVEDVDGPGPSVVNAGRLDYSNDAGGENNPGFNGLLVFDVSQEFTLLSVTVFAYGTSSRTIQLRDASGTVLETTTVSIPDGEQQVTLNWTIPVGNGHELVSASDPSLFRTNQQNGTLAFPYDLMGSGEIIGARTEDGGNLRTDLWYYFYNWEISVAGLQCSSARTPATVTVLSTGIADNNSVLNATVFPNPTTGNMNLELHLERSEMVTVEVVNAVGAVVATERFAAANGKSVHPISVQDLAAGIYLVKVNAGAYSAVERVVVE